MTLTRRTLLVLSILLAMTVAGPSPVAAQNCPQITSVETIQGELLEMEELEDPDDDSDSSETVADAVEPADRYRAVILIDRPEPEVDEAVEGADVDDPDADTAGEQDSATEAEEDVEPVDEQREFVVVGKGDKLEVGETYEVTISEAAGGDSFEDRIAYLGEELECSSTSTIVLIEDDGTRSPIDVSGFDLPSLPVTPRQVGIAFGGLAIVTFLFREPRVNQ